MTDIAEILIDGKGTHDLVERRVPWEEYKALAAMNPSTIVHGTRSMCT